MLLDTSAFYFLVGFPSFSVEDIWSLFVERNP